MPDEFYWANLTMCTIPGRIGRCRGPARHPPPGIAIPVRLTIVVDVGRPSGIPRGVMSEASLQYTWTWEAYLEWEAAQPVRYELVDGQVYAMGGGTAEHDTIGNNLRRELWTALRG